MGDRKTVVVAFQGEHKPTGAQVHLRIEWDGSKVCCDDSRCSLCGCDVGLVIHTNVTLGRRDIRTAVQCTSYKSWFEEIGTPGHVSHEPLTIAFE